MPDLDHHSIPVSFRLPTDVWQRLEARASARKRPISINEYCKRLAVRHDKRMQRRFETGDSA